MIYLGKTSYPYMEEVNQGILGQFRRLPEKGAALDVGCGFGALGEALTSLGWKVVGVENNQESSEVGKRRISCLLENDLHDYRIIKEKIGARRFDALIFADVLEHVYNPREVIENYRDLLRDSGKIFVSVPNAVVWSNRFKWLFGKVNYTDSGIMDRTHIRFFSFRTAKKLVEAAGFTVDAIDATPFLVRSLLPIVKKVLSRKTNPAVPSNPRALIDSRAYQSYLRYVYPIERFVSRLWKSMFAFQIIIVGTKKSA